MRSIKSGRLRLQVFSIDNKWRAARLAELSLRTSHLVLRTFVGTTNINLSSYADLVEFPIPYAESLLAASGHPVLLMPPRRADQLCTFGLIVD